MLFVLAASLFATINQAVAFQTAVDDEATLFDSESGDLTGWKIVSGEFGEIVSDRATFHDSKERYNHQGKCHLSRCSGAKALVGSITANDRTCGERDAARSHSGTGFA